MSANFPKFPLRGELDGLNKEIQSLGARTPAGVVSFAQLADRIIGLRAETAEAIRKLQAKAEQAEAFNQRMSELKKKREQLSAPEQGIVARNLGLIRLKILGVAEKFTFSDEELKPKRLFLVGKVDPKTGEFMGDLKVLEESDTFPEGEVPIQFEPYEQGPEDL